MNDLRYAFRQLLKNPGFTVHPPQCLRPDRVQFPKCCSKKPRHLRQYCYGGRAVAVLTLALSTNGLAVETPQPRTKPVTPSGPPSAKAIIAKYVEAIGGRDAILKHRSCHWSGKFELPAQQVSGSLDVFGAQPHKQLLKVNIPITDK